MGITVDQLAFDNLGRENATLHKRLAILQAQYDVLEQKLKAKEDEDGEQLQSKEG